MNKRIFKNNCIYLFNFGCAGSSLLHGRFPNCGKLGLLSSWGVPAFIAAASLVVAPKLWSTGSVVVSHSTWAHPESGIEPLSPCIGFFTPEPPGKPQRDFINDILLIRINEFYRICVLICNS